MSLSITVLRFAAFADELASRANREM